MAFWGLISSQNHMQNVWQCALYPYVQGEGLSLHPMLRGSCLRNGEAEISFLLTNLVVL